MQATHCSLKALLNVILLSVTFASILLPASVFAADADREAAITELKTNQAKVVEAQTAKDAAVKTRDELAAQQASKPSVDTERKLKDADTEVMLADSKLNSAKKSAERSQKKLDEIQASLKPAVNEEAKKAAEEQARKTAEAAAAASAAKKAAEEQAHKAAETKAATQKASEEGAKKAAETAEAAAKKQALAAELGIDKNCIALPSAPTHPSTGINEAEQAYAQGFLKQLNQLVAKKTADDVAPINPVPVLEGSKLSPCDPDQKLALKFGYMGNGQYRMETPVLAGEQVFTVKNVQPLNRTIPESDNGEIYMFFLDGREGRTKLTAYKKSLFGQPAP
jgi:hypothetical protein